MKKKKISDRRNGGEGNVCDRVDQTPEVKGYYEIEQQALMIQWGEISRRLQAVLSYEIPRNHPNWIHRGSWAPVAKIETAYELELDGVILRGLAIGEGGGGEFGLIG